MSPLSQLVAACRSGGTRHPDHEPRILRRKRRTTSPHDARILSTLGRDHSSALGPRSPRTGLGERVKPKPRCEFISPDERGHIRAKTAIRQRPRSWKAWLTGAVDDEGPLRRPVQHCRIVAAPAAPPRGLLELADGPQQTSCVNRRA